MNGEKSAGFLGYVLVASIVLGLVYKSWWVFGGAFLGLLIGGYAVAIKESAGGALLFGIVNGWLGYELGSKWSATVGVILAIVAFFAAVGYVNSLMQEIKIEKELKELEVFSDDVW
jgi:hypothetical protein